MGAVFPPRKDPCTIPCGQAAHLSVSSRLAALKNVRTGKDVTHGEGPGQTGTL
jgi:hypothetical protein